MSSPRRWLLVVFGAVVLAFPFVTRRMIPPKAPLPPPPSAPTRGEPERPLPPTPPTPVPVDPLRDWATAILRHDEKGVLAAQSLFLSREGEYREPLMTLAKEHEHPRVRAFSVAVLGRMASRPREEFFVERLGDPHEYPRTSALQALERIGTKACLAKVDALAASDPAEVVRGVATQAAKAVRSR